MRKILSMLMGLLVAAAVPAAAQSGPAEAEPLRLELNIPALKLVVWDGERQLRTYPVAVGKPGHDTPHGEFRITHAEWNPWWRPPQREWARGEKVTPPGPSNPMGRVKLFFAPLYFIHGTPAAESIGTPASHGCVRMRNEDVIELARLVHERAGAPVTDAEIDRILARHSATRRVDLPRPVELRVRYTPVVVEDGELRVYPDVYGRSAIHTEAVYQALLEAGYDVSDIAYDAVRAVIERARGAEEMVGVRLVDAFGDGLVAAGQRGVANP